MKMPSSAAATQPNKPRSSINQRLDLEHICSLIKKESRVLDVGCGDGTLLMLLRKARKVKGRGIEISHNGVSKAVARGLSVVQGDADNDLVDYPDKSFDYVILTRTIQATHRPAEILREALRVGDKVIVSLPNFGYWRIRMHLLFKGKMPQSDALPMRWYDTLNIHLCTLRDFIDLCDEIDTPNRIEQTYTANSRRTPRRIDTHGFSLAAANFLAEEAIFVLASA